LHNKYLRYNLVGQLILHKIIVLFICIIPEPNHTTWIINFIIAHKILKQTVAYHWFNIEKTISDKLIEIAERW